MPDLIIATANRHKLEEYRRMLSDQPIEIGSLLDYPQMPPVEETGSTFAENAALKALAASNYCQLPAVADDSGLEVEALDGRPGIHSSRYADSDPARIAKLLGELQGKSNRRARFVCHIAIAFNGEVIADFEGEVKGRIADAPCGTDGFGYDPVFIPDGCDRTFGELSAAEKDRISHRANALRQAQEFVEDQLETLKKYW